MDPSPGTSNADTKVKAEVVRLYKDIYLKYGFSYVGPKNKPRPKCLVCKEELDNENMKARPLKDHYDRKHRDVIVQDYFTQLENQKIKQGGSYNVSNDKVANYEQNNHKNKQPTAMHRAVPYRSLPAREEVKPVSRSYSKGTVSHVPPSHISSGSDSMKTMISVIRQQLKKKLCGAKVSLLLDIHHECHLMSYVRFVDGDSIVEHFLSYIDLTTRRTESDICNSIPPMLGQFGLQFQNCVSIFVASMDENKNVSFVEYLQKMLPNKTIKCWYARHVLITRTITKPLQDVMNTVDTMIQSVIFSPIGHKISEFMCQVMESRHKALLFCSKYWMFRSEALRKFYDQKRQLSHIFTITRPDFADKIRDQVWWSKFAYFVDISQHMIDLIESMQGDESYIFTSMDKIKAFLNKIKIWKRKVTDKNFNMFQLTFQTNPEYISPLILQHLSAMENTLPRCFPLNNANKYNWIRNPFDFTISDINHLDETKQKMLENLSDDHTLKQNYNEKGKLVKFWSMTKAKYSELADDALSILLQFSSSRMLDEGRSAFHAVTFYKEKQLLSVRERLVWHFSTIRPQNSETNRY